MNKLIAICIMALMCHDTFSQHSLHFDTLPSCKTIPVANFAYFQIGDKFFFGGGGELAGHSHREWWMFSIFNTKWSSLKAPIWGSVDYQPASFELHGRGFVCGGFDSTSNSTVGMWKYDPNTDTWEQRRHYPSNRVALTSFAWHDMGYVGMGVDSIQNPYPCGDIWRYNDTTDTWAYVTAYPDGHKLLMSVAVVGDYAYFIGGRDSTRAHDCATVLRYDLVNDNWQRMASVPGRGRSSANVYPLHNHILVGGGASDNLLKSLPDWYLYDVSTDHWDTVNVTGVPPNTAAGTFVFDKSIYMYGGLDSPGSSSGIFNKLWVADLSTLGISTGVGDIPQGYEVLSLYPNPATQYIDIHYGGTEAATIALYDISGQLLHSMDVHYGTMRMDISELAAGAYMARLSTAQGWVHSYKVMVMRE